MPIRKELRGFYPIDWQELSRVIRFERAGGRCEGCGRPHGQMISHLGDRRWFDPEDEIWRDGQGRAVDWIDFSQYKGRLRQTRVALATAHLDHNPSNNRPRNLKALCQRCHLKHDRKEHRRRTRITIRSRRALGDLFEGHTGSRDARCSFGYGADGIGCRLSCLKPLKAVHYDPR